MDSNSLNKNVAYTSIARFSALAFTFIYSILLVRLLGTEGNGVFTLLIANAQIAILFLGLSTNTGLNYFLAKGDLSKEKVLAFTVFIFGIAALITICISFILFNIRTDALSFLLPLGYQDLFFLLFFFLSFLSLGLVQICSAIATGNFFYKNINRLTFFISLYKRTKLKLDFSFPFQEFIKPFMIYSLKSWMLGVLAFFSGRFFTWVVTYYQGLKSLGILALAVSLFVNAQMFFNPIYLVLSPYLIKFSREEGIQKFLFFLRITTTIAILFS